MTNHSQHIVIIGAGIGGLTAGAFLAQAGHHITVLETEAYPGGCAGTYVHKGYRFDAGATLAGGFQPGGPHDRAGKYLGITWPVRPVDPAWIVHLPDRTIRQDGIDIERTFPQSARFWHEQRLAADQIWALADRDLPWPPTSGAEGLRLLRLGLAQFPGDLRLLPLAFQSMRAWLDRLRLSTDESFVRFLDAQLLISAQTTSDRANALYGAVALDLPRQGVQEVEGGMGGIAAALVESIRSFGGQVLFKHRATQIAVTNGRAVGIHTQRGRRAGDYFPCDFLIANLTPWSLDPLLGEASPVRLRREVESRPAGWGAFALYLGVDAAKLPSDIVSHHQIITTRYGPLGEGRSIFVSFSPAWDTTRAPADHRAVTVTTHTAVAPWWTLAETDHPAYEARKADYTERLLSAIDTVIPGFRSSVVLTMPGTPLTYQAYTGRHKGMVGGFPLESIWQARGPQTGLANVRLVGDSIFPGQSTAGVTAGAMRLVREVLRLLPGPTIQEESPAYWLETS